MAFEFETPLILGLRKALGSGLTLAASIFHLLTALLFGFYIYLVTDSFETLPILAVIFSLLPLLSFIVGLTVFVGAKKREKMLSSSGATVGMVFSFVSLAVLVASYIVFMKNATFFEPIGNVISFFGIKDGIVWQFKNEIFFAVCVLLCLISLGYFSNVRKTILNNRPKRAFSLLLAIFLITVVALFAALAVYYFITGGINGFSLSLISIYTLVLVVFILITLFLTGLCSVKYFTSCGGNKNDF